jgi:hypothetical protein
MRPKARPPEITGNSIALMGLVKAAAEKTAMQVS